MSIWEAAIVVYGIETIRCAHKTDREQEAGEKSVNKTSGGFHNAEDFPHPLCFCDYADYRTSGSLWYKYVKNPIATVANNRQYSGT